MTPEFSRIGHQIIEIYKRKEQNKCVTRELMYALGESLKMSDFGTKLSSTELSIYTREQD